MRAYFLDFRHANGRSVMQDYTGTMKRIQPMSNRTVKRRIFSPRDDALSALAAAIPGAVRDGAVDWDALRDVFGDAPAAGPEKYEFTWAGKAEARREAERDIVGRTLRLCPEESLDAETTRNLYIEGDNLEALKLLRNNYYGAVKLIYIDPPYNTGNDFIYRDNFAQTEMESELAEGNVDAEGRRLVKNPKSSNRYHADWLSLLYPRLRISRDYLTPDGLMAISIDDHELTNLKKCCDEIFGERNFIAQITVLSNPRGRQAESLVAPVHEYLLLFARNIDKCRVRGERLSEEQIAGFSQVDSRGRKYRLLGLRKRGADWRREDSPTMYFPIYVNPATGKCGPARTSEFNLEVFPMRPDGQEGRWRWGKSKVESDYARLEAKMVAGRGEWDVFTRDYLRDGDGGERIRKIKTLWDEKELNYQNGTEEIKALFEGETVFPYAKPMAFLKKIISLTMDDDSLTLDFFSGSAGLAHAMLSANAEDGGKRNFIMVQWAEKIDGNGEFATIADLGRERIRRAGRVLQAAGDAPRNSLFSRSRSGMDCGFKAFRIADTVIRWTHEALRRDERKTLDFSDISDKDRLDFMPGFNDIDVVYEIALRQNDIPLSAPVRSLPTAGRRTYLFAGILVCLEEEITPELAEALAAVEPVPAKFVLRDSSFEDNITLKDETLRRLKACIARNAGEAQTSYVVDFI